MQNGNSKIHVTIYFAPYMMLKDLMYDEYYTVCNHMATVLCMD